MDAEEGLSKEEIEQFTDVMLGKLSQLSYFRTPQLDPGKISRDEIRSVIVDTELLVTGKVPLERWVESHSADISKLLRRPRR